MLDGQDLLAILPTGAGKSGLFYMYMLVLISINNSPQLIPQTLMYNVPKDPAMVIIYPTNTLQEEQVSDFTE
jgi:replicative superfamily II helicase